MKVLRGLQVLCFTVSGTAWASSYNLGNNCPLFQHRGNWQIAKTSDLKDRIRDPLTQRNGQILFKVRGKWFATRDNCLIKNQIDQTEGVAQAADPVWGEAKSTGGWDAGSSSSDGPSPWVFDLSLGLASPSASAYEAKAVTTSGYTVTSTAATGKFQFGLGVGYRLKEDLMVRFSLSRHSSSQAGVFSGSVTGNIVDAEDFYHFGLGAVKHLFKIKGKLRPYAGVDAGYSIASGLWSLTQFSGIFTAINGSVDVSASGLFLGLRVGADWEIARKISIFPEVSYLKTFYGKTTVNQSTSSLYRAGEEFSSISETRLVLSVGARYWM